MSAPKRAPGVAKARVYRHTPDDGHEHAYRIRNALGELPPCFLCGEPATWPNSPRHRREGAMRDGRHALFEPLKSAPVPMNAELQEAFDRELADSDFPRGAKRLIRTILWCVDWRTLVVYRNAVYLYKKAGLKMQAVKRRDGRLREDCRIGRKWLEQFAQAFLIARSSAPSSAKCASFARHLHYDPGDERLVPPTQSDPSMSAEYAHGVRWVQWLPMTLDALRVGIGRFLEFEARRRGGAMYGKDPTPSDLEDPPGSDLEDPPGSDLEDPPGSDLEDPPFHRPAADRERRLSHPSIKPPTSALSALEGDPPSTQSAPEDQGPVCALSASPNRLDEVTLPPSRGHLAIPSESESREGEGPDERPDEPAENEMRTASGPPEAPAEIAPQTATSAEQSASSSRTPVRLLPEASRALSAIAGRARRASEAAKLAPLDGAVLFGWLVRRHKAGCSLEWLEAWGHGVARGGGEARDGRATAKAAGVNAFQYATGSPELYVHEGRKLIEAERYAGAARDRPVAEPRPHLSREEQAQRLAELMAAEESPS